MVKSTNNKLKSPPYLPHGVCKAVAKACGVTVNHASQVYHARRISPRVAAAFEVLGYKILKRRNSPWRS